MTEQFIQAINDKTKIRLTFYSKQDGENVTRLCAPMDYGPSRRKNIIDTSDKFHLWDYKSPSETPVHTISLSQDQIVKMEFTDLTFNPSEFVNWATNWWIKRNWGV
jgi:hypothetical protein